MLFLTRTKREGKGLHVTPLKLQTQGLHFFEDPGEEMTFQIQGLSYKQIWFHLEEFWRGGKPMRSSWRGR